MQIKKIITTIIFFFCLLSLGNTNEELKKLFHSYGDNASNIEQINNLFNENIKLDPNSLIKHGRLSLHGDSMETKLALLIEKGLKLEEISIFDNLSPNISDFLFKHGASKTALFLSLFHSYDPASTKSMAALLENYKDLDPNSVIEHGRLSFHGDSMEIKLALLIEKGLKLQEISMAHLPLVRLATNHMQHSLLNLTKVFENNFQLNAIHNIYAS